MEGDKILIAPIVQTTPRVNLKPISRQKQVLLQVNCFWGNQNHDFMTFWMIFIQKLSKSIIWVQSPVGRIIESAMQLTPLHLIWWATTYYIAYFYICTMKWNILPPWSAFMVLQLLPLPKAYISILYYCLPKPTCSKFAQLDQNCNVDSPHTYNLLNYFTPALVSGLWIAGSNMGWNVLWRFGHFKI